MAALTLYHIAPSRSSVVHWMLEEIGEPFDLHVLNMKTGENRQPDYLAINPMGKVPALRHNDVIITEVAAKNDGLHQVLYEVQHAFVGHFFFAAIPAAWRRCKRITLDHDFHRQFFAFGVLAHHIYWAPRRILALAPVVFFAAVTQVILGYQTPREIGLRVAALQERVNLAALFAGQMEIAFGHKSGGRKRRPQGCSLRSHRLRRLKPLTPTLSSATHSATAWAPSALF